MPAATRALLILNIAVFGAQLFADDLLVRWFALWPPASLEYPGAPAFEIWQLVTYGFLHGSPTHLFFNMFALWMFGGPVEEVLGTRRYALFYFACVIGAACAQLAVMALFQPGHLYPTVGASGGVFGLLLAFAMFYPKAKMAMIFLPIPVPAPIFVAGYVILELVLGVTGTQAGVAHFAHLGGALVGFVLIKVWQVGAARSPDR